MYYRIINKSISIIPCYLLELIHIVQGQGVLLLAKLAHKFITM